MSETIAEMVLPGTYIEVRAEGLIGVGAIATGNIGIVGTATRGPVRETVVLGGFTELVDTFGPAADGVTLSRAAAFAYQGGGSSVYAVRIANGNPVAAARVLNNGSGTAAFTVSAATPGTWGNAVTLAVANQGTGAEQVQTLTVAAGALKEEFAGPGAAAVRDAVNDPRRGSRLVRASTESIAGNVKLAEIPPTLLENGTDNANVSSNDVRDGLAELVGERVNILLVAGMGVDEVAGAVAAHLEASENEGRERIAILGASSSVADDVVSDAASVSDDRIVLVAPGLVTQGPNGAVTHPPSALAAVVAGQLSTLAPQVSLTNKALPIDGLDVQYSSAAAKRLLDNRALIVRRKLGFQVVKGITTDPGAFRQVSVRRIVDYAKAGVRSGADPYIGKLNNARVRAALRATLDGFLSQMVLDEMLVSYDLEVTATRAQEINGICAVTMTLRPTFSIDFIRVTMNLE